MSCDTSGSEKDGRLREGGLKVLASVDTSETMKLSSKCSGTFMDPQIIIS